MTDYAINVAFEWFFYTLIVYGAMGLLLANIAYKKDCIKQLPVKKYCTNMAIVSCTVASVSALVGFFWTY